MGFLSNYIYGLLSSNCHPSLKMAEKMAAAYQYPLSWSILAIFYRISIKINVGLLLSNPCLSSNTGLVR